MPDNRIAFKTMGIFKIIMIMYISRVEINFCVCGVLVLLPELKTEIKGKEKELHCWWECRLVQPLWKTIWNFLRKLKMELPFVLATPLLGLYPKNP